MAWAFIGGLVLGVSIGVFVIALVQGASRGERIKRLPYHCSLDELY